MFKMKVNEQTTVNFCSKVDTYIKTCSFRYKGINEFSSLSVASHC